MEKAGIIFPSTSYFANLVIIVLKKKDSTANEITYRMVEILGKWMNNWNTGPAPLMYIDRIFSKLNGSKLFSTCDIRSRYYNITIAEYSRQYTAFTTEYGKYEFLKSPFWHSCSTQLFHTNDKWNTKSCRFCFTYLDNIIIYSKTEWHHLDHIKQVLDWLRRANIKLKMTKCAFFKSHIHYLGHLLSQDGISCLPEKLDAIKTMPPPQNTKEMRQFLGLTGYYRNHIKHYADITNSITNLLKQMSPTYGQKFTKILFRT